MIEKIKELVIEKVLEFGYIVVFALLSELLNFFHPVTGTKGFLGLLIDKFLNGSEMNSNLLNPCIELFGGTTLSDLWILVFFNFRDALRNRRITDPENAKETSGTFKMICFYVSLVVRFLILLVLLNFFEAKELFDKFSIPMIISLFGGFSLLLISMGARVLTVPTPGGAKTKAVFKVIKGVTFLAVSALALFIGGFAVMHSLTNDVAKKKPVESTTSVEDTTVAVTSNGIFVGTRNGKDFYLLPETFSGDNEKFHVTAEYINKSANHKDQIVFYFVHYRTGWTYHDSIDESSEYVKRLRDDDVVKQIWDYCMQVKLEGAVQTSSEPTQDKPPKKPQYRYPQQRENGRLVWAGYMKNYSCYLDTQSVHVFDNTNEYKDWEQVVKLYDEDRFVESVTQNFHWDPQEGACVGGRGISRITDKNLMYQFETGWQYAFGHSFK